MTVLYTLASTTLVVTPLILILLLLTPLLNKRYAAKGRYYIWLVLMCGLCLPFISAIPRPSFQIEIPVPEVMQIQAENPKQENTIQPDDLSDMMEPTNIFNAEENHVIEESTPVEMITPAQETFSFPEIDVLTVFFIIWLAGIAMSLGYHSAVYLRFRRFIRRWAVSETDIGVLETYHNEAAQMSIRRTIRLMRCKCSRAPLLAGYFKTVLLLPEREYSETELSFIFRHELTHYKRLDLWYKLALMVIRSVYWFNPAVHLMAAQAGKDVEAVCDMQVVDGMEIAYRKRYSEVILNIAADSDVCRSQLTTCFMGGKEVLKQRLANVMKTKKRGVVLFSMIGAVVIAVSLLVGFSFNAAAGSSDIQNNPINSPSVSPSTTPAVSSSATPDINAVNLNSTQKNSYENLDELKALLYSEPKWTDKEYTDITALQVSTNTDNIKITRGGDKLKIHYPEWMENEYALNVSGGKLSLKSNIPTYIIRRSATSWTEKQSWLYEDLEKNGKVQTIEITIPASVKLESVDVDVIGNAELRDCEFGGDVNIDETVGTMTVTGCTFNGRADFDIASGRISANGDVFSSSAKLDVASGSISFENNMFNDARLSIASGSGTVKLSGDIGQYGVRFSTVDGNLTYNGKAVNGNALRNDIATMQMKLSSPSGAFAVSAIGDVESQPSSTPAPADIPDTLHTPMQNNIDWGNLTNIISEYFDKSTKDASSTRDYIITNASLYNSIDDLKHLVFDEAKLTEREFDIAAALNISTASENIKITRGGDKMIIRYYQWLDNQYSITENNGKLTFRGNWLPYYLKKGSEATNGWYVDYLRSLGKDLKNTVEIVIPESMSLNNINLSTAYGSIDIIGQAYSNVNISSAYGPINVEGLSFSNMNISTAYGEINITLLDSAKNYDIVYFSTYGKLKYNGKSVSAESLRNFNAGQKLNLSSADGSINIKDTN